MGNNVVLFVLFVLLFSISLSSIESQGSTIIEVVETNSSSNTEILDIRIISLEITEGMIQSNGPVYQISSNDDLVLIEVEWNFTGLFSYTPILENSTIMGDTYYSIDGEMTRINQGFQKNSNPMFYLFASQGVHTLSLLYIGINEQNETIFDIDSIYIEVRKPNQSFGFQIGEIGFEFNLYDLYTAKPFNNRLIANSNYDGAESNRVMKDDSIFNSATYDSSANILSIEMTFNSSGSIQLQNTTGNLMSQGIILFSDARGTFPLTSSVTKLVVFPEQASSISLSIIRHAGFLLPELGLEFGSELQADWEGLQNYVNAEASFDVIIEDNLLIFTDGITNIITETQTDNTQEGPVTPPTNSENPSPTTTTSTFETSETTLSDSTPSESDVSESRSDGEVPGIILPIESLLVPITLAFIVVTRRSLK